MGLITLQDIFCLGYPDYEQTHALPAHVRKAARAIMQCRTAALGGHVQACPDGHVSRIWYNSCRHRSCPQCAFLQVERWLTTQRARLVAARPVASCWCARQLFRVGGPPLPHCPRSVPHEAGAPHDAWSASWGWSVRCPLQGGRCRSGAVSRDAAVSRAASSPRAGGVSRWCAGWHRVGVSRSNLHSTWGERPPRTVSVRGLSNQSLKQTPGHLLHSREVVDGWTPGCQRCVLDEPGAA